MSEFGFHTSGEEIVKKYEPEVRGKTVLITGPSESGLGGQTAVFLAAAKPKLLVLAGRTESKIQPIISKIKESNPGVETVFLHLDLASLTSIRAAASRFNQMVERLDILINNAGIMAIKDYTKSVDGIEMQFAVNHVGHFLFSNLIMERILAAGKGARIINLASLAYLSGGINYDDCNFQNGKAYNPWLAYAQSKTANILFTSSLVDKLKSKSVAIFAVHPGWVETKLLAAVTPDMFEDGVRIAEAALDEGEELPTAALQPKSLAVGTSTILWAALDPSLSAHSGAMLSDCAIVENIKPHATGKENEDRLWSLSEKLVGQQFTY